MDTNIIEFESADIDNAMGTGSISTLKFDIDVELHPLNSSNPMAPTHRILAPSPAGRLVECGGVWKKLNKETQEPYYTLSIRDYGFNANLGRAANQDDEKRQAVIPWAPREAA